MTWNRSVPTDSLLPHIVYPDVARAIDWLSVTFGFEEHYRYGEPGGPLSGAQMHLGNAWFMLCEPRLGRASPAQAGIHTQMLTVFVNDVGAHFERTETQGARIFEDLHETAYGERQYGVEDLAGHRWLFSQHAQDLSPDLWGASVAQPVRMPPQISPMLAVADGGAAIDFYRAAFGASVLWRLGDAEDIVAGLAINGALFFLATASPDFGTRGPAAAGFTTVRIELFVDDPIAVHRRSLAAGAREHSPVTEHHHATAGLRPIRRMLQGAVVDPFGHMWLIGRILE
jgi:uncharacterized glyoxalase superfamily protein PhnB